MARNMGGCNKSVGFYIGGTALERNTWSRVEPHKTATLYTFNHIKVLQSNAVQP